MTDANPQHRGPGLSGNRRAALILTVVPFLLLGFLERLPGSFGPALAYFAAAGVWALYVTPRLLGLPNGRKPFLEYCADIRLLPASPIARNVLLGLLLAALALAGILLASVATGRFALDWSFVPAVRWVKGLTRGVWEEVFFRGIALAILMRFYPRRLAALMMTAMFAVVHLNVADLTLEGVVDVVSIFFIGLLFVYVVLKTGSLLPAIVFHYVYDIFVLLVQNTPGAQEPLASVLLYAFLWAALIVGAGVTRLTVERWPPSARVTRTGGA